MSERRIEERIAQLQAQAQAQRLGAQLAIIELREQTAPLRAAVRIVAAAARALSPARPAGGLLADLVRHGLAHPWLTSTLTAVALRAARRRPVALLLAAAAGLAAWWLLRPPRRTEQRSEAAG